MSAELGFAIGLLTGMLLAVFSAWVGASIGELITFRREPEDNSDEVLRYYSKLRAKYERLQQERDTLRKGLDELIEKEGKRYDGMLFGNVQRIPCANSETLKTKDNDNCKD